MANSKKTAPHSDKTAEDKGLPVNDQAERLVIGSVLRDDSKLPLASEKLEPKDFSTESHRRIFDAILEVSNRSETVDRVTVANELLKRGQLEGVGGLTFLSSLDRDLPSIPNLPAYVKIVRDKSLERQAIFATQMGLNRLMIGEDLAEVVTGLTNRLFELQDRGDSDRKTVFTPDEVIEHVGVNAFYQPWIVSPGIPTGFEKLDELMLGLIPSHVYILAAETRVGKTSAALNITANIIRKQRGVLYFSGEMTKETMLHRLACTSAGVSYAKFRRGWLEKDERGMFREAVDEIRTLPYLLDDTTPISIADVERRATRAVRDEGVQLVVVDYLQRMDLRSSGDGIDFRDEYMALTYISGRCMALAKKLKVPLLLLSQFNRGKRGRQKNDLRPKLSDLRGAGALEQDAHVIIFIYREEFDRPGQMDLKGTAEFIVAKNRNGQEGTIKMKFKGAQMQFVEDIIAEQQTLT